MRSYLSLIIVVGLAVFSLTSTAAPADKKFEQFLETEWQDDLKTHPEFSTSLGLRLYNDKLTDYSLEAIQSRKDKAKESLTTLKKIKRAKRKALADRPGEDPQPVPLGTPGEDPTELRGVQLEQLRLDLNMREEQLAERQAELNRHLEEVRTLETERKLAEERLESAHRELGRARAEQADAADRRAALTSTVRVVDRVHRRATHRRTLPQPAAATRLAAGLVLVVRVPDLSDGGPTG